MLMLIEQTMDKLNAMKLAGTAEALRQQLVSPQHAKLSFDERLGLLVDAEWLARVRRRIAAETMRGWLKAYRRGGFEALMPQSRSDRGRSRAIEQAVADVLCAIKEERPALTVPLVIRAARERGVGPEVGLPPSTVHRLLSRQGLMARLPNTPDSKDRRRFCFELANQLWMSDVMHGASGRGLERRGRRR